MVSAQYYYYLEAGNWATVSGVCVWWWWMVGGTEGAKVSIVLY